MTPVVEWYQIALRLGFASTASFAIGFNRDERSHPAGIRTTMLVCLTATFAMLATNLLLPTAGKGPSSFVQIDPMRLPLGVLTGIGFIGAGAIVRKETMVTGLTTAATIWMVTVLGFLFGSGQLLLGSVGTLATLFILWILRYVDAVLPRKHRGTLSISVTHTPTIENEILSLLHTAGFKTDHWQIRHDRPSGLTSMRCEVSWDTPAGRQLHMPQPFKELRALPGLTSFQWEE